MNSIRASDEAELKAKKQKEEDFLKSLDAMANPNEEEEDDLFFQKPL